MCRKGTLVYWVFFKIKHYNYDANVTVCVVYCETYGHCCHFTITAFPTARIDIPSEFPLTAVINENFRLTCSGSGDPDPTYMWYLQDENGKD